MEQNKKLYLGFVLTVGFLLSCAPSPQQIAEKTLAPSMDLAFKKGRESTVRLVGGNFSEATTGSGFFVDNDKIATNIHVLLQQGLYFAKLIDKEEIWAVEGVTAFDAKNDLAILKISGEGMPLVLGDSDALQRDEPVFVIGFPGGKYKNTKGVFRSIRNRDKWLQMKIELSAGNSGGPVLNRKGQVIGIAVQSDDTIGSTSYNPVIPSNTLKALLARSGSAEPLTEWQKRPQIQAYVNYGLGMEKYENGHYKGAVTSFDKAIELNPEFIDAYLNRGNAKYKLGAYYGAIADFDQAIQLNPEHALAYNNRGSMMVFIGHLKANQGNKVGAQQDYHEAIEDCTKAIKFEPDLADAYGTRGRAMLYLGGCKADRGNIPEAEQYYLDAINDCTNAIKLNPDEPKTYLLRAMVRGLIGEFWEDRGDATKAEKHYLDAINDCTNAIKLNPEDAKAYYFRGAGKGAFGRFKAEQGKMAEAQQYYQDAINDCTNAIKLNPHDARVYHTQGGIKYSLGKSEVSRGWAKYLFKKPEAVEKMKAARKLYHAAIADFDKAIQINPMFARAYYDRALAKETLGQHDAANADFEKARKLDPNVGK